MSYSRRSPRLCEALKPTVMRHTGVEKSAEAIVVATRRRRAESAVRSRTWIAQTTGKKSEAGNRENLATKGGEVECRDMGARCQSGCDEKRTREHAERTALNCGNREVPATGTLRGVGGEAFLPYPIYRNRSDYVRRRRSASPAMPNSISKPEVGSGTADQEPAV